MSEDDLKAWLAARGALDHHDTVTVLTEAMPALVLPDLPRDVAYHLATELGRKGYALVKLDAPAHGFLDRTED